MNCPAAVGSDCTQLASTERSALRWPSPGGKVCDPIQRGARIRLRPLARDIVDGLIARRAGRQIHNNSRRFLRIFGRPVRQDALQDIAAALPGRQSVRPSESRFRILVGPIRTDHLPGRIAMHPGRHLAGALRRGDWIARCPAAENRPVKILPVAAGGEILQKSERGLRIFIGQGGDDGLHGLVAHRTGRQLLDPGARPAGSCSAQPLTALVIAQLRPVPAGRACA